MNRAKGILVFLLCVIFSRGICAQQTAKEKAAQDHVERGDEFVKSGDLDGAIAEFRSAIRLDHNLAEAHFHLGNALTSKHDWRGASAEYEAAAYLNTKFSKAPELTMKLITAYDRLGIALLDTGDETAAIGAFGTLSYLNRDEAEKSSLGKALAARARGHLDRGFVLLESKKESDLDAAVAEFRKGTKLDPTNATAHWGLAGALDAELKPEDALEEYRSAMKLDPTAKNAKTESAPLHIERAANFHTLVGAIQGQPISVRCQGYLDNAAFGCVNKTIAEYRIALLFDPDNVAVHVGLGRELASLHKTDDAAEEFRAALRVDPQSAEAHLGLGKALEKKGRLKDALQEYGSALSLAEAKAKYEKLSAKLGVKK